MRTKPDLEKLGVAQAALLAAALGLLALALVNLGTVASEGFRIFVTKCGRICVPGAEQIGVFSGKEAIFLAVWLLSWFFLHRILRTKEWNQTVVLSLFLAGIALATTLLWPPVTHAVIDFFKGT